MKTIQHFATISALAIITLTNYSCKKEDAGKTNTTTIQPKTISCDQITANTTWADVNADPNAVDYIINCWIEVDNGAVITVAPGVRIQFTSSNGGIGLLGQAGLNMQGTADKPIVLEGVQHVAGEWSGIQVKSNSASTIFEYVTFADAGSTTWEIISDRKAAVQVAGRYWGSCRISKINHCTFKNSLGAGIFAGLGATISTFGNNSFIDNQKSPIITDIQIASIIDNTTTFTNNTQQFIDIYEAEGGNGYTDDITIKNIRIPYRVANGVRIELFAGAFLIEPGVTFEMGSDSFLEENMLGTAVIRAVGNPTSPITFTGTQKIPGFWGGITIATSLDNRLDYCNISYGGSSEHGLYDGHKANVFVHYYSNGKLTMNGCKSDHSLTYGLSYRSTNCDVNEFNNTYTYNTVGEVEVYN